MCGICGFVSKNSISIERLKAMNDLMAHRGPDDSGEEIFGIKCGYSLGLAQRRLSILDLSELGHQPMHSENGRVSIVFNGEIYNYLEIKKELSDYEFRSNCDTEVIIAAYLRWGISCISRFNGMFAIALYDREIDTLYLIRDRIGKKPLYYWLDGENIVFASECKPIMNAFGFKVNVNKSVLKKYLCNQYIQTPDTVFENVYKLEPGGILEFKFGKIKKRKYWDVVEQFNAGQSNQIVNYGDAKRMLQDLLLDSIKKRLIADVPVGCFLSGGYDSSLVTTLAQSVYPQRIKTFSIGFENSEYDEAKFAKTIAQYLGTDHTELYITEKQMLELVESIPKYFDEPFADASEIPMMLVASLAKQKITVALSGDGGDELFCGYRRYYRVAQAQRLDKLGALLYGVCNMPLVKQMDILSKFPHGIRVMALNRKRNEKTQFHIEDATGVVNAMLPTVQGSCKYDESAYLNDNWQQECMLLDQETYLPSVLCKVDRASMKYSLECRSPILDHRVIELSYRLPHDFVYSKQLGGKAILKDITFDFIPKELLDRPKHGFGAPVENWLRTSLKEMLLEYSTEAYLRDQGIFSPKYTSGYIRDSLSQTREKLSGVIWSFFIFQQWYKYYLE